MAQLRWFMKRPDHTCAWRHPIVAGLDRLSRDAHFLLASSPSKPVRSCTSAGVMICLGGVPRWENAI